MANKQTIKPKVVPFEIVKLLKEVGYDEKIAEFWAYASPWTAKGGIRKVSITEVISLIQIPSGRNLILSFLLP